MAYIDYVERRYDKALEGFRAMEEDRKYRTLAPYYIADIYLIKGNYPTARRIAETYLAAYPNEEQVTEMKRVAGEAAYGQNDYASATRLLSAYQNESEHPERNALYKLGMSYFHTQVYSKAAATLGEAVGEKDALSQNAYLHMGLAYLQLKEHTQARMAFEQASSSDFDRSIKEQALYNYALCIHETSYSPFAESVTVFERFLNEFPNSAYTDKVNDYLIEVYMNTRSYMAALQSIEKSVIPASVSWKPSKNCCSVSEHRLSRKEHLRTQPAISPALCSWDNTTNKPKLMLTTGGANRNIAWSNTRKLPTIIGFTWNLPPTKAATNTGLRFII